MLSHLFRRHRLLCVTLAAATLRSLPAPAQATPVQGQDPALTLNVQSRLVLEDILVFDRTGHPVFHLPRSAFHLTDNDHPQTIRSFEEGAVTPVPTPAITPLPPGTFRNISNATDHTASDVLLIDADSMSLPDQTYLLQELQKSIDALPPGLAVAVFRVSNTRIVQIRSLDTDRADLHRALRECLPVITRPVDDQFDSAVDQLLTVSSYLQQTPGRKNILWFAGAFPLVSISDAEAGSRVTPNVQARLHIIHQLQEGLAEARVSVYPIDVRGVISIGPDSSAGQAAARQAATRGIAGSPNPAAASGITPAPSVLGSPASGVVQERSEMRSLADATGGRAYTLNHLAPEISEAFTLGLRAYALSYTPSPYQNDDSWHRVRLLVNAPPTVPGPLSLSYRPGYLATWTGLAGGRVGIRLDPGNAKVLTGGAASVTAAAPLPFEVQIEPGTPDPTRKHTLPLTLRFTIPAEELDFHHTDTGWHDQLVIASYVYNAEGRIRGGRMQQVSTTLNEAQWTAVQGKRLPATQTIDVPSNADYLMLELRDAGNHRAGSLMLSMRAVRSLSSAPSTPDALKPADPSRATTGGTTPTP